MRSSESPEFGDTSLVVLSHPSLQMAETCEGMAFAESKEGLIVITLNPSVLPVSDAIAKLAAQTEIVDVSVSGATSEEMVAALYQEYRI